MEKVLAFYRDKPAGPPTPAISSNIIPVGKTWIVYGISTTGPGVLGARGEITWDGNTVEAWQGDKFNSVRLVLEGDGIKELQIQLYGASVYIGCTLYYEELG